MRTIANLISAVVPPGKAACDVEPDLLSVHNFG